MGLMKVNNATTILAKMQVTCIREAISADRRLQRNTQHSSLAQPSSCASPSLIRMGGIIRNSSPLATSTSIQSRKFLVLYQKGDDGASRWISLWYPSQRF